VRADLSHSDAAEKVLVSYCHTPEAMQRGRRAGNMTLWAWREMHDGILREIRKRHVL